LIFDGIRGVQSKPLVGSFGYPGEGGIRIIMNYDNCVFTEMRSDEAKTVSNRFIEVAIKKGKGDFFWQISIGKVGKPAFFDNWHWKASTKKAGFDLVLRNIEGTWYEISPENRFVFG
jgi:hypothetical protein